ncbi:hypothetical protein OIU84_010949 [Salix udensis]|uniref:Cytochrome P450 n=1 Tax=Salix udensis TaxID=889485 RepID=A0AAD6NWQ0_9ROSI|nr:hypothetical protein OIU84_010949 [Salix udensis]
MSAALFLLLKQRKIESSYQKTSTRASGMAQSLSAEAAAELFKNHDLAFSDRKVPLVLTAHNYNQGSMAIGRSTSTGRVGEIKVAHYLFIMTFNLIGNLVLSRDLVSPRSIDGHEFYDAMNKFMKWAGTPNVADFFPFLKWLDPQGIMRNMVQDMGQAMRIVEKFVKERTEERKAGEKKTNDFPRCTIGKLQAPLIEWAMTELLRNPVVMGRATEELHQLLDPEERLRKAT